MAYSNNIELNGYDVILCACDVVAEALYRGSRYSEDYDRTVPVNRWLCEQCKINLEELDFAELRAVKYQRLPEEIWEAWEVWYEKNAS